MVKMPNNKTKTLLFVTGNKNKHKEVQEVLGENFIVEMVNIDLPEIQGTDQEIIENKVRVASSKIDGPFIVEDTSLEFNALNGMPGPYVKWFLKSIGNTGLHNLLEAYENKRAKAICNIAYCDGNNIDIFRGISDGFIVNEGGKNGFGWDRIFMPVGYDRRYSEMDDNLKNSISHRRKALDLLKNFLNNKKECCIETS